MSEPTTTAEPTTTTTAPPLTPSPAAVIATHLAAGQAWPVKVGTEPADPADVVTCFDTAPVIEARTHRTAATPTHPGILVRVRSATYPVGWSKICQLAVMLDAIKDTAVLVGSPSVGYTVRNCKRASGPLAIGTDELNRHVFTLNVLATLSPT